MERSKTAGKTWKPHLTAQAERDLAGITLWTFQNFGARQATTYRAQIYKALRKLRSGADVPGSRRRPDIAAEIYTLNIRPQNRNLLLYRHAGDRTIAVIRILHVSMDLPSHIPPPQQSFRTKK